MMDWIMTLESYLSKEENNWKKVKEWNQEVRHAEKLSKND